MSFQEEACCFIYRAPKYSGQSSYASYYSDCGEHLSDPILLTHSATCYIYCPDGERDCSMELGWLGWAMLMFFAFLIFFVVCEACVKCRKSRLAREAAVRRNLLNGGEDNQNNSVVLGQTFLENDYAQKPLNATTVDQGTPGDTLIDSAHEVCIEDGSAPDKQDDRDESLYGSLVV